MSHPESFFVLIATRQKQSPDQSLEEYVGGIQRNPDDALIEQSVIRLRHGYTGIKIVFKSSTGSLRTKVYFDHNGLVYVLSTNATIYSTVFDRLLDSLELP
jgi:hypothetical protein